MEATKNPKTDAQRDQYLALCRYIHDNIIFNYGSVENYIAAKNTEINTAESKLQSYYDNPRKGKSRRAAIIAGLENTIFIMKNSLTNTLRDLEELNAATPSETPQISTETAETVNVSAEGENEAERKEIKVQTIADMVAIGESLNKGESVSFKLHLHFLWSVTITNESAEWCEGFKYSLDAKCLDNPQSFGRRYTSFGLAMLHCLNRFNENANIRDDYETLSAVLNKPQNLISDFRAPQSPERKIKYFHYTPEQLKRYIIDVYDKRADGEWVLDHQEDSDNGYYDVIDGKVIYWHDKRANRFSFYNMDFNSPTCGRCFQVNSTYQKEKYIVSNEILMEFLTGDFYRNIHKQTVYNNGKYEHYYSIQDRHGNFNVDDFAYTFDGIMQRFNDCYKDYATIIWQSSEFAPQSPETPQTVE